MISWRRATPSASRVAILGQAMERQDITDADAGSSDGCSGGYIACLCSAIEKLHQERAVFARQRDPFGPGGGAAPPGEAPPGAGGVGDQPAAAGACGQAHLIPRKPAVERWDQIENRAYSDVLGTKRRGRHTTAAETVKVLNR